MNNTPSSSRIGNFLESKFKLIEAVLLCIMKMKNRALVQMQDVFIIKAKFLRRVKYYLIVCSNRELVFSNFHDLPYPHFVINQQFFTEFARQT